MNWFRRKAAVKPQSNLTTEQKIACKAADIQANVQAAAESFADFLTGLPEGDRMQAVKSLMPSLIENSAEPTVKVFHTIVPVFPNQEDQKTVCDEYVLPLARIVPMETAHMIWKMSKNPQLDLNVLIGFEQLKGVTDEMKLACEKGLETEQLTRNYLNQLDSIKYIGGLSTSYQDALKRNKIFDLLPPKRANQGVPKKEEVPGQALP